MRLFLQRTLIALLACVLTFLAAEGAYRLYKFHFYGLVDYPDVFSLGFFRPDPVYGMVAQKNIASDRLSPKLRRHAELTRGFSPSFRTNSWGYRGKEFSLQKAPQIYRIAALGGSTTMCMELGENETWPAQLEARLNENQAFLRAHGAVRVEVINAANGGWRSRENLIRVREDLRRLDPDLLLLALSWNDVCLGTSGEDPDRPVLRKKPWWYHSALLQNLRVRYLRSQDYSRHHHESIRSRLSRDKRWAHALFENVAAIQAIADEKGAQVILVNLPGLCRRAGMKGEEYRRVLQETRVTPLNYPVWVEFNEFERIFFKEMGESMEIPVADIAGGFEAFSGPRRVELFVDEMHVTSKGAAEVARLTSSFLVGWRGRARRPLSQIRNPQHRNLY